MLKAAGSCEWPWLLVIVAGPHQQTIWDKWQSERFTSAEDDTHSHSFIGLGCCERTGPNYSFGIQRQLWPKESLFAQGSIINQSMGEERRLPELYEPCWQITSEILSMNANGQTSLALTLATAEIPIRVRVISRSVLFTSPSSSRIISILISAALKPWLHPAQAIMSLKAHRWLSFCQ